MHENNNAEDQDLLAKLDLLTEKKSPTEKPPKSFDWADGADESAAPAEQPEVAAKVDKPGAPKMSPEEIKRNAAASAAGIELITSLLSEAIINLRYYFKLTDDERIELDEKILDENPAYLSESQTRLKSRYERLMTARDKKLGKISTSEKSRRALEAAFEDYTAQTGKTFLTPKSRLGVYLAENIIKTVIAAVTD